MSNRKGRVSSYSDDGKYPLICRQAAENDIAFNVFRANKTYRSIVETCGPKLGLNYLYLTQRKNIDLRQYFERFQTSDSVGGPKMFEYEVAGKKIQMAPTTLRYINILSDLMTYFGSLEGMNIIEIGGGYGGQCKIIQDVFKLGSYTLVDLEPALALSKRFLGEFNINNVSYLTSDDLPAHRTKYDMVISNFAFTEIIRQIQNIYCEHVISKAPKGYMLCNFVTHTWEKDQFSEAELLSVIGITNVVRAAPPLTQYDESLGITLLHWSDLA